MVPYHGMITVLEKLQSQRLPLGEMKKKDSTCDFETENTTLYFTLPLSCSIPVNNFPRLNSNITSSETDNTQDGINEIHLIGGDNILNS